MESKGARNKLGDMTLQTGRAWSIYKNHCECGTLYMGFDHALRIFNGFLKTTMISIYFNSYPWLLKKNCSELISWENTSYFNNHFFEPHAEEARSATVEKRCTHQFGAMTQPRDQQGKSTFCRLSLLKSAMDPLTIESEIASHLPGIIDSLVA